MSGWIKVEDRLPDVWQEVLTVIVGTDYIHLEDDETFEEALARAKKHPVRVTISFLDEDGFWNGADGFPQIIAPSYWMPFPEPPEEVFEDAD